MIGTKAHSLGLGVQFNVTAGGDFLAPGLSLVICPTEITRLAINWYFNFDDTNIIGLTFDICPLTLPISTFRTGSFNFTLGAGFFADMVFSSDFGFNGGVRFPVGFNLKLGQRAFVIYTHVAPSFGLRFIPDFGFHSPFFPIAIGARLWFRS